MSYSNGGALIFCLVVDKIRSSHRRCYKNLNKYQIFSKMECGRNYCCAIVYFVMYQLLVECILRICRFHWLFALPNISCPLPADSAGNQFSSIGVSSRARFNKSQSVCRIIVPNSCQLPSTGKYWKMTTTFTFQRWIDASKFSRTVVNA